MGEWPDGGPKREWTLSDIGRGYASPIVVNNTIYIPGDGDEKLFISAVSLDGKLRWRTKNGARWTRPYPGARAACTYDDGKLYHMNAHGWLACLDVTDGSEVWSVDVLDRFYRNGELSTCGGQRRLGPSGDLQGKALASLPRHTLLLRYSPMIRLIERDGLRRSKL